MSQLRRYVGLSLLAGCTSLAACSSGPDDPAPDLAARLEKDTGTKWTVYVDPRSHEVRFLAPERPVQLPGDTPEGKARAFFTRYKDDLHATGKADELRITTTATDARGGLHLRFDHVLPGTSLPVFDSGTTAHFNADGAVYWLQADFRADLADLDATATVAQDAAIAKALAHVQASCGAVRGAPIADATELGVLSDPDAHAALAYRVRISVESERCGAPSVFVDAKSGAALKIEERAHAIDTTVGGSRFHLLQETDDLKTISVTAAPAGFQMVTDEEPSTRVITSSFQTKRVVESRNLTDWDTASVVRGAAVDAHFKTQQALRFLRPFANGFQAHDRAFVMPLSLDVSAIAHDNTLGAGANAFASFDPVRRVDSVHFGDGNFPAVPNALPWSAAYDIVTHEVTHLITQHTSNLKYERESGALNESFSDVMGAAAEHAVTDDEKKAFLIGEDLYYDRHLPPGAPRDAFALRSMDAPQSMGDRDHVENAVKCPAGPMEANDYCGVHTNSGIPNRVFALIVAGGSVKKNDGKAMVDRPIGVPHGIGWEKATELTYWAATGLNATPSFQNAALAQIAEAARVGGRDAFEMVTCAWYAVGVLKPSNVVDEWFTSNVCTPPAPAAPSPPPPPAPTPGNVCSGHGDAPVCDPTQPSQAIRCKNGAPVPDGPEFCASQDQTCIPVSPTDSTATFVEGVLQCQ